MTDFEQTVLGNLAELKAQMRALVGNGQPGRIHELEARVEKHEALAQRATGVGAVFGMLAGLAGTMLHIGLDYLWKRNP